MNIQRMQFRSNSRSISPGLQRLLTFHQEQINEVAASCIKQSDRFRESNDENQDPNTNTVITACSSRTKSPFRERGSHINLRKATLIKLSSGQFSTESSYFDSDDDNNSSSSSSSDEDTFDFLLAPEFMTPNQHEPLLNCPPAERRRREAVWDRKLRASLTGKGVQTNYQVKAKRKYTKKGKRKERERNKVEGNKILQWQQTALTELQGAIQRFNEPSGNSSQSLVINQKATDAGLIAAERLNIGRNNEHLEQAITKLEKGRRRRVWQNRNASILDLLKHAHTTGKEVLSCGRNSQRAVEEIQNYRDHVRSEASVLQFANTVAQVNYFKGFELVELKNSIDFADIGRIREAFRISGKKHTSHEAAYAALSRNLNGYAHSINDKLAVVQARFYKTNNEVEPVLNQTSVDEIKKLIDEVAAFRDVIRDIQFSGSTGNEWKDLAEAHRAQIDSLSNRLVTGLTKIIEIVLEIDLNENAFAKEVLEYARSK